MPAGAPFSRARPRTVVFDVGNVLYRWDPHGWHERRTPDAAARARMLAETDFYGWHERLDAGLAYAESAAALSARFPQHAAIIDAWGPEFGETITEPVPGMPELVAELDAAGVPLFAITNFSADFWAPFRLREAHVFDRFRAIVVSGEEKLVKPDAAIYALALQRFGIAPEAGLFVDDRIDNVAGARAAGMHAHHFIDAADLRARLVAEGLL